jgi:hypothetical protein
MDGSAWFVSGEDVSGGTEEGKSIGDYELRDRIGYCHTTYREAITRGHDKQMIGYVSESCKEVLPTSTCTQNNPCLILHPEDFLHGRMGFLIFSVGLGDVRAERA